MVELINVAHTYKDLVALEAITAFFPPQSFTAIVGPNGAGKSTLLKIIAGLLPPSKGQVAIEKEKSLAYLPQQNSIDHSFPLTVFDVTAMGLWKKLGMLGGLSKSGGIAVYEALAAVGLQGLEKRNLMSLSGGQFQRLLFARMMLQNADILLLDEPFAAIDLPTTQDMLQLMKVWQQQGKTIIAVMHNLALVREFFPTTFLLAKKLIAYGETARVLKPDLLTKASFGEG